jgi:hypothetical protein
MGILYQNFALGQFKMGIEGLSSCAGGGTGAQKATVNKVNPFREGKSGKEK